MRIFRCELAMPTPDVSAERVLCLLDLTSLGEDDRPEQIEALCTRAHARGAVAAVCVYPEHISTARRALQGTTVKIATVVNFPDAGNDALRVARETRRALAAGADEIDVVMPWPAFCRGEIETVRAVLKATRETCSAGQPIKVILETGELATPERIRAASELGIECGMDFLKTSTGKVKVNATLEAAAIMLDVIAAHGGHCGFKAAGGIRTLADAEAYMALARDRLGDAWITPAHFRIGASALYDALLPALPTA
jgi:deoxyribose-phosphate aldolase